MHTLDMNAHYGHMHRQMPLPVHAHVTLTTNVKKKKAEFSAEFYTSNILTAANLRMLGVRSWLALVGAIDI